MDNNKKAFTIIELIISILISVILLWGIFYFLSDTILGIAKAGSQSRFLKDFYSFTTVLDTWNTEILHDNSQGTFDVALLESLDTTSGILIWVVDNATLRLSGTGRSGEYHNALLGYRSLSSFELSEISSNPDIVYEYDFFPDKLFYNFHLQDFQLQAFNSWATMEVMLSIFTEYRPDLEWDSWEIVPKDDIFEYSIVF